MTDVTTQLVIYDHIYSISLSFYLMRDTLVNCYVRRAGYVRTFRKIVSDPACTIEENINDWGPFLRIS